MAEGEGFAQSRIRYRVVGVRVPHVDVTRLWGTHNRYFSEPAALVGTLTRVFGDMQRYPELIRPHLQSFF